MVPGAPWFSQYAEWTLGSLRDILRTGNPYQATGFSNSEQSSASIPDSCTKKTIQGEEIWHRCNPSLIKEWQVAQKLFPLWAVLRRRKSICDCSGEAPQPPWEGCQAWAPFLWTDQRGWQNPVMGGSSAAAPHGSIACKPGQDHCPWHSWVSRQEELEITRCSKMRRTQSLAPFRGPLPVFILSWGMKVSVGEGGISYTGWLVDIYIIISAQFYFRRNLTKCSLNFSLLGITEFPVLLLKLCAEESNCGQGGMSGSGSCACTSRIAAAVVVAAPQGSKLGVTAGESPQDQTEHPFLKSESRWGWAVTWKCRGWRSWGQHKGHGAGKQVPPWLCFSGVRHKCALHVKVCTAFFGIWLYANRYFYWDWKQHLFAE